MEASYILCGGVSTLALKSPGSLSLRLRPNEMISLYSYSRNNGVFFSSRIPRRILAGRSSGAEAVSTKRRSRETREDSGAASKKSFKRVAESTESGRQLGAQKNGPSSVRALYQNGDPLGRRDLGKGVVQWICQGMKAMASDFAMADMQGEFSELKQRMGPGLTFVIQAQPYLNAIPMPLGLEAICLKACTHYPTLFDNFQRELRDVLQDLQQKSLISNWRETESWKLLKELANSGIRYPLSLPPIVRNSFV